LTVSQPAVPTPLRRSIEPTDEKVTPLVALLDQIIRHATLIAIFSLLFGVVAVIANLVQPRLYTSTASFIPQASGNKLSALSSVASQFGLSVGSTDQAGSLPDFYLALLQQKTILGHVVDASYQVPGPPAHSATLVDIYGKAGNSRESKREQAIQVLSRRTTVTLTPKIGLVRLDVSAPTAPLAQQLAQSFLRFVNETNLEMRRQRAADEGKFIDDRLELARGELFKAEDQLQYFLRTNRDIHASPELTFQHDRLQREVTMRQQIFASLSQAYEQARLDQVRDTPLISVVEPPQVPPLPDPRHLGVRLALGLLLGFLFGFFVSFLYDYAVPLEQAGRPSEFLSLLQRLFHPLRRRSEYRAKTPE
jgi:uncharacterized protein involved in exopolysaccharide biosynthesis